MESVSDKISFISCIIPEFADSYKMSIPNAYKFLNKYGGLKYLLDNWKELYKLLQKELVS